MKKRPFNFARDGILIQQLFPDSALANLTATLGSNAMLNNWAIKDRNLRAIYLLFEKLQQKEQESSHVLFYGSMFPEIQYLNLQHGLMAV